MTRRLLGPVGGPILFFLVTITVFGVLGWVTHSALRVEQAQREAAARAELGSNLRVALWRLDGRMLPALGVEYSRPFYQYGPADPVNGYGFAATPLLSTDLPDWMKLHFQLDEKNGWDSPQVLCKEVVERVREAWGLPLQNVNDERRKVLGELRMHYPVRSMLVDFTSRDRSFSGDSVSSSTPSAAVDVPTPSEPSHIPVGQPTAKTPPKSQPGSPNPTAVQTSVVPSAPSNNKRDSYHLFGIEICICSDKPIANNLASNQLQNGPNDGMKRNEGVGQPGPRQIQQPTANPGRGGRMSAPKDDNSQTKADNINREAETKNRAIGDVQPPQGNYRYNENSVQNLSQLANELKTAGNGMAGQPSSSGTNNKDASLAKAVNPIALPTTQNSANTGSGPTQNPLPSSSTSGKIQGNPAATQPSNTANPNGGLQENGKGLIGSLAAAAKLYKSESEWSKRLFDEKLAKGTPDVVNAASDGPAPLVNYLGSMRPQWISGSDGSERLVLVRVAKVDNKDVCQGIILDWPTLESMLKDEVKDLFPDAKLIPVKDPADISPDRIMTALPIQLDPGLQPEPPPAGLTTLRLGLLLAWAAAIIAVAAVGFCGWTLIDLAERRIRFVSAVTHELRTPLTSLRLYLDLLVSGMIQDEAKKQEYLNTLTTESDRLHRLIDNVLDFARLEKRRKDGDKKPIKVAEIIEQVRQTWADRLTQEGRELAAISTLPVEQEVKTDAALVQQIIGNLIDNARKYSHDAADRRIWVWAKPNGAKSIAFEIEDRGPGVPANERRSIFKPFRRGEQADKSTGGAGLGLALAKSWAEVLGGRLSYRPADGGTGACFRLELPIG
jgi:signal transduction histidine kinase